MIAAASAAAACVGMQADSPGRNSSGAIRIKSRPHPGRSARSRLALVLSSHVANQRAGIGVRAMKAGKDFLADKPGITTLDDLALVRQTIAETGRTYAVMYSERLEVRAAVHAGELIRQGAIGKVIQTINIAPHQVIQHSGDNGGGAPRPGWFWEDMRYGGILCDIGSHQIDQFLFYTGSTKPKRRRAVITCAIRVIAFPFRRHDAAETRVCYVRLDWFTPMGLYLGHGRVLRGRMDISRSANTPCCGVKQGNTCSGGWKTRPHHDATRGAARPAIRRRYRNRTHRRGPAQCLRRRNCPSGRNRSPSGSAGRLVSPNLGRQGPVLCWTACQKLNGRSPKPHF